MSDHDQLPAARAPRAERARVRARRCRRPRAPPGMPSELRARRVLAIPLAQARRRERSAAPRSLPPSTARVRAALVRCCPEARPQLLEVRAGVDVEQQRRRTRDPAAARRPRGRARGGARQLSGPEARMRSRPGGLSSRPLVPVPWRSGTITTARRASRCCGRPRAAALQLSRVERGAVAGHAQHALEALGQRARAMPSAAAADWPSSRGSASTTRREAARCRRDALARCVTTIVSSIASACDERVQHVRDHRRGERRRACGRRPPRAAAAWRA